jgi:hypothetical protein
VKNCFLSLIIVILLISVTQILIYKKFYTNIIPYSLYKIVPLNFIKKYLFNDDYYKGFENRFGNADKFNNSQEYLDYLFNSSPSRLSTYLTATKEIFKKPLLGHGYNTYLEFENFFGDTVLSDNYESHLLTILIEIGFVGFFFYLYIFIHLFIRIEVNKEFYVTLLIGILMLGLFNSYQRNIFLFYLLAFIFSNIIENSKKKILNNKA